MVFEKSAWRRVTRSVAIDAVRDVRAARIGDKKNPLSWDDGFELRVTTGIGYLRDDSTFFADMAEAKVVINETSWSATQRAISESMNSFEACSLDVSSLEITIRVLPDHFGNAITTAQAKERLAAVLPLVAVKYTPAGPIVISQLSEIFDSSGYEYFIPSPRNGDKQ